MSAIGTMKGFNRTFLPWRNDMGKIESEYANYCYKHARKFQIHTEGSQMEKEFQHIKYECLFSFLSVSFSFHLFNITQNKNKK